MTTLIHDIKQERRASDRSATLARIAAGSMHADPRAGETALRRFLRRLRRA